MSWGRAGTEATLSPLDFLDWSTSDTMSRVACWWIGFTMMEKVLAWCTRVTKKVRMRVMRRVEMPGW